MPEEGVAVEADLGVEGLDRSVGGGDEGVDLHHRAVLLQIHAVEPGDDGGHLLLLRLVGETEAEGELTLVKGLEAGGGIDEDFDDLLGGLGGHFLDVHSALGGSDEDELAGGPIEGEGEVILLRDVAGGGEVNRLDLAAGGAGLVRDEGVAEHAGGEGLRFRVGGGDLHPALEAVGEGALAPSAGMDLGLHHNFAFRQVGEGGVKLGFAQRRGPGLHRDAIGGEEFLGLVLVDVHGGREDTMTSGIITVGSFARFKPFVRPRCEFVGRNVGGGDGVGALRPRAGD
jgi:hypothetical protein